MRIITLHNEKGGVGKSTLAVHLAAALTIEGQRVVLIDTDPQGHSAYLLGVAKAAHIYDLLVRDADWGDCLQVVPSGHYAPPHATPRGELFVCASNPEAISIPNHIQEVGLLRERVEELNVDTVIIDTSPTPSMTNALVFYASDGLVLPSSAEQLGLDGLASTAGNMTRVSRTRQRQTGSGLQLLGVQTNLYDARTSEHQHGYETIQQQFGSYAWEPVATRTAVREAAAVGKSVFAYDSGGDAAKQLWAFADRVKNALRATND